MCGKWGPTKPQPAMRNIAQDPSASAQQMASQTGPSESSCGVERSRGKHQATGGKRVLSMDVLYIVSGGQGGGGYTCSLAPMQVP